MAVLYNISRVTKLFSSAQKANFAKAPNDQISLGNTHV